MWHLKSIVLEKWALFWGLQHTFMGFWEDRWENIHFSSKPKHVTPQIDHLGKTSTVLRISTYIHGVFEEIDGKTFILRVNLGMWPLKSIVLEKCKHCSEGLNTHLWGFSGDRWENMHSQPSVATQHKKTNKVVWTCKDDWPPKRTSTYERPFTQEGNYLVYNCTHYSNQWNAI